MIEFGLIGYPLSHSFSQKYFEHKFKELNIKNIKYSLFPISEIKEINHLIANNKNLCGLNVTTPYKEAVIPFLHYTDPLISKLETVNVIKIERSANNFYLKGYNTDFLGLKKSFEELNFPANSKALVLGSGGSGKTVAFVLENMNIPYNLVSRNPKTLKQISYQDLNKTVMKNHNIIINASPVGMFPNINLYPSIPYEFITPEHICFDLIYNPFETLFLKKCSQTGAKILNGLKMFYEQAEESWKILKSKNSFLTLPL